MKFCSHCGKEVADDATVCMNCGCGVNSEAATEKSQKPENMRPVLAFVLSIVAAFLVIVSYCGALTTNMFLFNLGMSLAFFAIPIEFGLSVASLVIGLVINSRNKEGKEQNKKFVLTAIIISSVLIVLIVILVMVYFFGYNALPAIKFREGL